MPYTVTNTKTHTHTQLMRSSSAEFLSCFTKTKLCQPELTTSVFIGLELKVGQESDFLGQESNFWRRSVGFYDLDLEMLTSGYKLKKLFVLKTNL